MNTYNYNSIYTKDKLTNIRVVIQSYQLCDMYKNMSTYTWVYLQLYE